MDRVKRGIILSASVLIAGFLFVLAQPAANTTAYQNSTNLQLNFAEMIRMNLSDSYQMRIAADGRPHFQRSALKVYLETNSYYGYDFFMETENPDLVNTADPTQKITNLKTANNLIEPDDTIPMNTWGLSVEKENGQFQDVFYTSGNNMPLKSYTFMGRNTEDVAHDRLAFTIGARVDDTIPSGTYTTSIRFTLVPRVIPNSIENTTYLQDVTSTAVGTMQTNTPYRLTDLRDNKKYFIAKDSSGKVMMIQNLDYDLSGGDTLGQMTSEIADKYKQISNVGDHVSIDYNQAVYVSGNNIYRDSNGNETINNEDPETAEEANNKAGGYYSYAAAIANSVNLYEQFGMVKNTLCPKNWRIPNRLEAQSFNANSPQNTWSNNNGFISLDNNIKLDEGQYYWTAEFDKSNKLVDVYNPVNGNTDHYIDARNLASVRCQFNNLNNFSYKLNLVYDENYTDVRTYNTSGITVSGTALAVLVSVDWSKATNDEDRIIGFSTTPGNTVPEYAVTTVLDSSYNTCFDGGTVDHCSDYVKTYLTQSEVTLYAVWSRKCNRDATTIEQAVCMQDMNPSIRDSMVVNQQYRLKDQRDGQKYWVTKLSDKRVYMTQNLNYYPEVESLFYSDHSDTDEVQNSLITASVEEGYYMKDGITKKSLSKQSDDPEEKHYNLGKYYEGQQSIVCPAKWHIADMAEAVKAAGLMTGDSIATNSQSNAQNGMEYNPALTNENLFGAPLYLTAGGYREGNKSYYQGDKAKYVKAGGNSVFAIATDNGVNVVNPDESRYGGVYGQIRCVSDPKDMSDIVYMQDITNEIIRFTPYNYETQLVDKRDGKKYWVKKDSTGYVFMTQNLDLQIPETGITFYRDTTDMDSTISSNVDTRESMYIERAHSIKADNNNPEIIYAYDAGEYYIDENRNVVSTEGLAEDAPELKEHVGTFYTATAASIGRFERNLFQTFTICPKNWTVESQQYIKKYGSVYTGTAGAYGSGYTSATTHRSNPAIARKYAPVNASGAFILRDVDTSGGKSGIWGNYNNHYFNGDVNNIANDMGFVLHPVRCVIDLPFTQEVYH